MKCNKYKLGDLCDLKIGRTPPRKEHKWFSKDKNDYKWVSIKDMGNVNKYISDSSEYLTEEAIGKFNIPVVNPNTILVSFKLTVGKIAITTIKMTTNEAIAQLPIKNNNLVNNEYLYYFLSNYPYESLGSTSSIATAVNSAILKDIIVELPNIEIQRQISKVLKEIDDKIELNNKINKNLLEQALLVYKLFFVTGYDFNNKEQKDWSIGTIADISEKIICGKTPSTKIDEYYGAEIPFITIPDMHNNIYITHVERKLSQKGAETQNTKYLPKNSIMVSCIGTAGLVSITSELSQTNQQINSIIPKSNVPFSYIYLSMLAMGNLINKLGQSGTTLVNLNKEQFSKINILIPTNDVLKKFGEIVNPLFNSILLNQLQNEKLLKLRDSLLPKLMSGEIDVSKIDI